MKKIFTALCLGSALFLSCPADGFSHHHRGYPDGYSSYRGHGGYYPSHHRDSFWWGAAGFVAGATLGAALAPPPVYYSSPPVYYSPPPPRMCRYERYVTDPWGRTYLEYFAAPCR